MKFTGSMVQDLTSFNTPEGSWAWAKNVLIDYKHMSASNENGFQFVGCDYEGLTIHGIIPLPNGYVQFSTDNTIGAIHVITDDFTCRCIIKDEALNFNTNFPIMGEYRFNYHSQLEIVFWEGVEDGANPPRLLNVDCLPFEVADDCSLVDPADIILLKQFTHIESGKIDLNAVEDNGGSLGTGVYYAAIAYGYQDGSRSNFFDFSNPVSIHDDTSLEEFFLIDGADPNTPSGKSIRFNFNDLDVRYPKLVIAVVSKIGGVITQQIAQTIDITSTSVNWVYNGQIESSITLSEIVTPRNVFLKVHAGTQLRNRLVYANVEVSKAFDIQPYVNNIKLKWVADDIRNISSYPESYKNPNSIFYFRDFRSFAVYAFYLIVHTVNGDRWVYHIPGRESVSIDFGGGNVYAEDTQLNTLVTAGVSDSNIVHANDYYPNTEYFKIFDTAKSDGRLGYWQNLEERYPNNDCMDIKDCDGNIIGSLRSLAVRHHRMPSVETINTAGTVFETPLSAPTLFKVSPDHFDTNSEGIFGLVGSGFLVWQIEEDNSGDAGDFDTPTGQPERNSYFRFFESRNITVKWDLEFTDIDSHFYLDIFVRRADGSTETILNVDIDPGFLGGNQDTHQVGEYGVVVNSGDVLIYSARFADDDPFGDEPDITAGSFLLVETNNPEDFPTNQRILGIKIEDLCIPEEYHDQIAYLELGYAERTSINNIVPDQDVIEYEQDAKNFRGHSFDSLFTKQTINYDFFRSYYKFNDPEPFIYGTKVAYNELAKINNIQYVPTNVNVPIDNLNREEVIYGTFKEFLTVPGLDETDDPDAYIFGDYLKVVDSLYLGFLSQPVVKTGMKFKLSTTFR